MKKKMVVSIFALSVFFVLASTVFAGGHKGGCTRGGGLEGKFYKKASFFLDNQMAAGLSEDQVAQMKALKFDVKRSLIDQDAAIKKLKVDIKEKMWQEKIDIAEITKLVEKKYELKKAKALYLVGSYAKIKGIPTEEQMGTFKEIWFQKKGSSQKSGHCQKCSKGV